MLKNIIIGLLLITIIVYQYKLNSKDAALQTAGHVITWQIVKATAIEECGFFECINRINEMYTFETYMEER